MKNKEFLKYICEAIGRVDKPYFNVQSAVLSDIKRERVFCYELYHQMRLILGDRKDLTINGEINKVAHSHFSEYLKNADPDFIFHTQGTHTNNRIVMEVKCSIDNSNEIEADLKTLLEFLNNSQNQEYSYNVGVFLLIRHNFEDLKIDGRSNKISRLWKNLIVLYNSEKYPNKNIFIIYKHNFNDNPNKIHAGKLFGSSDNKFKVSNRQNRSTLHLSHHKKTMNQ